MTILLEAQSLRDALYVIQRYWERSGEITQRRLAELCGVAPRTMHRWLNTRDEERTIGAANGLRIVALCDLLLQSASLPTNRTTERQILQACVSQISDLDGGPDRRTPNGELRALLQSWNVFRATREETYTRPSPAAWDRLIAQAQIMDPCVRNSPFCIEAERSHWLSVCHNWEALGHIFQRRYEEGAEILVGDLEENHRATFHVGVECEQRRHVVGNLQGAQMRLGRADEALRLTNECVRTWPGDPTVLHNALCVASVFRRVDLFSRFGPGLRRCLGADLAASDERDVLIGSPIIRDLLRDTDLRAFRASDVFRDLFPGPASLLSEEPGLCGDLEGPPLWPDAEP